MKADAICESCPFFAEGIEDDVREAAEAHMVDQPNHWARLTIDWAL